MYIYIYIYIISVRSWIVLVESWPPRQPPFGGFGHFGVCVLLRDAFKVPETHDCCSNWGSCRLEFQVGVLEVWQLWIRIILLGVDSRIVLFNNASCFSFWVFIICNGVLKLSRSPRRESITGWISFEGVSCFVVLKGSPKDNNPFLFFGGVG